MNPSFFFPPPVSLFMKKIIVEKDNEQRGWCACTGYYIRADGSTLAGMTMRSQDWGSATSTPPLVNDGLCGVWDMVAFFSFSFFLSDWRPSIWSKGLGARGRGSETGVSVEKKKGEGYWWEELGWREGKGGDMAYKQIFWLLRLCLYLTLSSTCT